LREEAMKTRKFNGLEEEFVDAFNATLGKMVAE